MVLHWGDGGTGSKQVFSRHVPLLGRGHTLAHPPMPYGALFTYLCPPSSPDIVYMAGPDISSPEPRRGRRYWIFVLGCLEALIGRPFFLSNHYDDTQSPLLMIFPTFEAPL